MTSLRREGVIILRYLISTSYLSVLAALLDLYSSSPPVVSGEETSFPSLIRFSRGGDFGGRSCERRPPLLHGWMGQYHL